MTRPSQWLLPCVAIAALVVGQKADAQINYYWNGGSGNWDTTSNSWRTPTTLDTPTPWVNSTTNVAQLGNIGSSGSLTLTTNITSGGINVNASGFTLQTNSSTTRTLTGDISLAAAVSLNLNEAGTTGDRALTIAGSVSGGTGITIQGSQTASNVSRVNIGVTNASVSTAITISQSGVGAGGIVATASGVQISGTIANSSSGATLVGATSGSSLTLASTAVIGGTQGVRFAISTTGGDGTITLNSQSTYSGATEFKLTSGGVVKLGVNDALPTGTAVTFGASSAVGGNLDLNGFSQQVASLASLSNAVGGIRNNASNTTSALTVSGNSTSGSFDLVIADNTSGNGKVAFARSGTGTTTLGGQNTYTGGTTVSGGTLVLGHATNTLSDGGAVTINGGTLSLGSNSDTVGTVTLAGGSITGSGTLTGSSYDICSGTISGNLGGSATMTKTTSGTVTISGTNGSYSGTVNVDGGTLIVTGSLGGGSVSVNSGGTLAGDNNTPFGVVTVANGGTIAPGLGGTTTGKLRFNTGVTFQSGSTLEVQLNGSDHPGTEFDQLEIGSGNISLGGTLSATIGISSPTENQRIIIITNTGTGSLTGTFSNYANGATVATSGGFDWKIYYGSAADPYGGTDGNDVVIVAKLAPVPEPGSIVAVCALIAGTGTMIRRWRRRRASGNSTTAA